MTDWRSFQGVSNDVLIEREKTKQFAKQEETKQLAKQEEEKTKQEEERTKQAVEKTKQLKDFGRTYFELKGSGATADDFSQYLKLINGNDVQVISI